MVERVATGNTEAYAIFINKPIFECGKKGRYELKIIAVLGENHKIFVKRVSS